MIGGWIIVSSDAAGGKLRVPWALSRSDDLAAGLIGSAALVPALVQPSDNGDAATRLSVRARLRQVRRRRQALRSRRCSA